MSGWKKKYHERYLKHIKSGFDYRPENKYNDKTLVKSNHAMLKFGRLFNYIPWEGEYVEANEYQLDLLDLLFPYIIEIIYNKKWKENMQAVMNLYNITKDDIYAHIITSSSERRNGKSMFLMMVTVAIICSVPLDHNFDCLILFPAQSEDIAVENVKRVYNCLVAMPEYENFNRSFKHHDEFEIRPKNSNGSIRVKGIPQGNVSINHNTLLYSP
jgi:hypothetical protein